MSIVVLTSSLTIMVFCLGYFSIIMLESGLRSLGSSLSESPVIVMASLYARDGLTGKIVTLASEHVACARLYTSYHTTPATECLC